MNSNVQTLTHNKHLTIRLCKNQYDLLILLLGILFHYIIYTYFDKKYKMKFSFRHIYSHFAHLYVYPSYIMLTEYF